MNVESGPNYRPGVEKKSKAAEREVGREGREDEERGWEDGGIIYEKDVYRDLSEENLSDESAEGPFSRHSVELKRPQDEEEREGIQFKVVEARVTVQKETRDKKLKKRVVEQGRFLVKGPRETPEHPVLRGRKNDEVLDGYKKMMALKEVNAKRKDGHQFNLPETVRLIRDENGDFKILVTDETKGGEKELHDLKHYDRLRFKRETVGLIREQILRDLELAEQNNVRLVTGEHYPLDAWFIIVDKETGEIDKVMLLDIGERVELDAIAPRLYRDTVEKALDSLQVTEDS